MKNGRLFIKIPCTKVRVSIYFVIFSLTIFISGLSAFTAIVLLCAVFHELGHIFAMRLFGVKIYGVDILASGAVIYSDCALLPYKKELAVAFSGIAANLVFSLCAYVFHVFSKDIYSMFSCVCSLFLALINVIPLKNLDGGRMLYALVHFRMKNSEKADKICFAAFYISSFFVICGTFAVLRITQFNLSLIVFCVCVVLSFYAENRV